MANRRGDNGNNVLKGTNDNDTLTGKGGDDDLYGRGGNDKLHGGRGDDDLYGGAGRDKFYFDLNSGKDFIRDFRLGQDKIYISKDYGYDNVAEFLQEFGHSSGGDTAIDLSGTGADDHQIVILGVDNYEELTGYIVFF